jgi:hypothetical protein
MDTTSALFAVAALGFQWGFQPADDGTIEYTIQLRPHEAEHLATSPDAVIVSFVPAEAQPVGRIRITVGEGSLSREPLPPKPLNTPGTATPISDPNAQEAAAGRKSLLTETQARVPAANGGNLGPARLRDEDAAGELVAVASASVPADTAPPGGDGGPTLTLPNFPPPENQHGDRLSQNNLADASPPTSDARNTAIDEAARLERDGLTEPTFTPGAEAADSIESPALGSATNGSGERTAGEPSPSDQVEVPPLADDSAARPATDASAEGRPSPDRPWLPLVGAIAVAFGFLAGNVFQWRSYMSLRKRYLHLLRKTGG